MCRNRNLWVPHTATRGQGPDALPERKCCVTGKHRDQNPCLLFLQVAYCCLRSLEGGSQKCSAHVKVCANALRFKQVISESHIRLTLYFQNPDELYGSVGYCLQRGNVWWGRWGRSKLCWNTNLHIDFFKKRLSVHVHLSMVCWGCCCLDSVSGNSPE